MRSVCLEIPANQSAWVSEGEGRVRVENLLVEVLELDGVTYYEGDLMEEDDCHSCFCSRGEKICKGQTCVPTDPPTQTTLQHEQDVQCVSGWTDWINEDKVLPGNAAISPLGCKITPNVGGGEEQREGEGEARGGGAGANGNCIEQHGEYSEQMRR